MLAVAWQNDLRVRFLIKKEALRGPLGWFFRSVGAIAVDRDNPEGLIDELIHLAETGHGFQLVLTPEGTRKPVEYWKSGFYRLSQETGIPMILVSPDGPTKVVTFGPTFPASGDVRADMDRSGTSSPTSGASTHAKSGSPAACGGHRRGIGDRLTARLFGLTDRGHHAGVMARFLCSHCGVDLRVVDRFTDYSTTRGPLTSYAPRGV